MRCILPVLLLVLGASGVRADEFSKEKAAVGGAVTDQKTLQQQAIAQLKAAPRRVGQSGSSSFAQGVMKNSADWLKQSPSIPQFINENGCAIKDGKFATVKISCGAAAADCLDFSKIVEDVAKNTEVVYVDPPTMQSLTGNAHTLAFGITKELKKVLHDPANPDQTLVLGAAGKNTIALRGSPDATAGTKAPDSGVFSVVLAHEFLHITLRQIDNSALGGGVRKSDGDLAIANVHHRLTDGLGWKAVGWNQSDQPWTAQGPDKGCAKAGQAAP